MSNIISVELGKYTTPKVVENKRVQWVEYGHDNNFYQTLLDSKDSPTNSALINGISDMIYGKGLYATDAARKPDEYAAMVQLFSEDLLRKCSDDFYTFGQASFQVIYNQKHDKIVEVQHMPIQNLRPKKCNDNGEIEAYFYSDKWADLKPNDKPEELPAFGFSKKGLEVLVIKPYKTGFHYFSPVEYQSGLDYAFVEIELAKYHLHNIFTKFSGNTIINFNNGRPSDDAQRDVERKIKAKHTGTEGDSVIISFNTSKEEAADVVQLSPINVHDQYGYIAEEAARKLMVSHRVTSPLLFGLPQNGGLGSNAEEIKLAAGLFDNTVIKPMQRMIVEAVQKILHFNQISLNVYMLTSQPLDFTEIANEDVEDETIQEQTGVALSKVCCGSELDNLDESADELIAMGEDVGEGWELVSETEVDYSDEDEPTLLSKFINLVSTGTARPNAKSEQDAVIDGVAFKTRYVYSPDRVSGDSRQFCRKMVSANKIYRKEDVVAMDGKIVNAGFGEGGSNTYSIWKYKGGARCHHKWLRRIYRKEVSEGGIDAKSPLAPTVSTNKSEKEGYRVRNPKEVAMKPSDMPNEGFVNPR